MYNPRAYIFDLDGVVVDTTKYHYLAWKRLAAEYGYDFTEEDNERFKGVSRMACMEILAGMMGMAFSPDESAGLADRKNDWYIEYIKNMNKAEVLPGFFDFITEIRNAGGKTALASASKNAGIVLDRLELRQCFDVIVDGNDVQKSKPDPQVFLLAAQKLSIKNADCVVFEDAQAGIDAANAANMRTVGIGSPEKPLMGAEIMMDGFNGASLQQLLEKLNANIVRFRICQ